MSGKAVSSLGLCSLRLDLSVQVAKYLTSQFYSLNYSLRQRVDILDVSALLFSSHFPLCLCCTSAESLRYKGLPFIPRRRRQRHGNLLRSYLCLAFRSCS